MVAAPAARTVSKVVIAGGGPAGDAVAAGLRDAGFHGQITVIGSEPVPPYERPHLSKGFLVGTVPPDRLPLRPRVQYDVLEVELRLGTRVVEIEAERRSLVLESGERVEWDRLCISTGAAARVLPGFEASVYVRELADAQRLRAILEAGQPVDVIGAGFIGCEVAAAARRLGCQVAVYEASAAPLERVLGAELGAYIAEVHRLHGVDMHLQAVELPAATLSTVVGVGSEPRTELASRAGIGVDAGILVDAMGRTSIPGIYAAGDVARFWSARFEARVRVEHFQTAQRHGFAVGRSMAGEAEPFTEVPWFWSDQYDLNLQYAGAGLPWDQTLIRGELGRPPFSVFYLRGGRPVAVAGVNDRHTVARTRHVMEAGAALTPEQIRDPSFDLRRALG